MIDLDEFYDLRVFCEFLILVENEFQNILKLLLESQKQFRSSSFYNCFLYHSITVSECSSECSPELIFNENKKSTQLILTIYVTIAVQLMLIAAQPPLRYH